MLLSFVIPVYNGASFLAETIDSILESTYKLVEIIIIDDGSVDDSRRIAETYQSQYPEIIKVYTHINNSNMGVSASRFLGVSKAAGELIHFIDADDVLYPETPAAYVEMFKNNPEVVLAHGRVEISSTLPGASDLGQFFFLGAEDKTYHLPQQKDFLNTNRICNSTVCVRTKMVRELEFSFRQAFQVEDWLLWTLLADTGKFFYFSKPVVKYRYHGNSATFMVASKGPVYYTYTKIEFFMALLAKSKNNTLKKKVSNLLYEHLAMLYKFYSDDPSHGIAKRFLNRTLFKDLIKTVIGKK